MLPLGPVGEEAADSETHKPGLGIGEGWETAGRASELLRKPGHPAFPSQGELLFNTFFLFPPPPHSPVEP